MESQRKTVELFISAISFLVLEWNPPWYTSVVMCVPGLECIVKNGCHCHGNGRRGGEDCIEDIVKLQI